MLQQGQWVHIPETLFHEFSGYDGKVVTVSGNSVIVVVHDIAWAPDQITLQLVPHMCMFRLEQLEPLSDERATTLDVLRHAIYKWNARD